jgi:iron-sulfur cluster assembly accessory protein
MTDEQDKTAEQEKPTLVFTEAAILEVNKIVAESGQEGFGLRISVVGGGCSGYQYQMELDNDVRMDDETLKFGNFQVVIDPISAGYIKGTTIDYKKSLQETGFVFLNPNAKRTCGCGSSFS